MKKIILCSHVSGIDNLINNREYVVIDKVDSLSDLMKFSSEALENIDIFILVQNNINEDIPLMKIIKDNYPLLRIVYLSTETSLRDASVVLHFNELIQVGIYDICRERELSRKIILELLDNPRDINDCIYLVELSKNLEEHSLTTKASPKKKKIGAKIKESFHLKNNTQNEDIDSHYIEDNVDGSLGIGYDNVIAITSAKPGAGKSFILSNIAVAIAHFGKEKTTGEKPKVAIVEGNTQIADIDIIFNINNEKYNLRSALNAVASIMDEDGVLQSSDQNQIVKVRNFILKCFVKDKDADNLFVLSLPLLKDDVLDINPYHYFYLIESIIDEFDLIFIDCNSSLEHPTTGPIFQLANICLNVVDFDYSDIESNLRHHSILKKMKATDKMKYILNRSVTTNEIKNLDRDIKVLGSISLIEESIVLNRRAKGVSMILDTGENTLAVRRDLTAIADKFWDMGNIKNLEMEETSSLVEEQEKSLLYKIFFD